MIDASISWAEKYRPKVLDDMIFPNQEWKKIVQEWLDKGKIDGNVALFGRGGLGKTSLAEVLIRGVIKSQSDLKRIKTRSVNEIDTLGEFMRSRPIASKQKIVYIEEADGLSREAQRELKEKYTEKYQEYCSIILTTNYPNAIDSFLMQRFLYKIDFNELKPKDILERVSWILGQENIVFNEKELEEWIEVNSKLGLRNIINQLQLSAKLNNGAIILSDSNSERQDIEDRVLGLCITMVQAFINCKDTKQRRIAAINPINSEIFPNEWAEFIQLVHNNYGLNYRLIMEKLLEHIRYIPLKIILIKYLENLSMKKYPGLHMVACLGEMLKCIYDGSF